MLITHPAVIDVAIWGEEVGAVVQLKAGRDASEVELIAHATRMLPPYKVPVRIDRWREEFPRNASGKTLKPMLREELLSKPVNA